MTLPLSNLVIDMRILILSEEGFEDIELLYPYYRMKEEGFEVTVASPNGGKIRGKYGYVFPESVPMREINPSDFYALILPGGKGPERIRVRARELAREIVRHFMDENKPIAAICHGPQLLITAGKVEGRKLTSYPGIADDLLAAGAIWVDREVVVDGNLITSRIPSDIPAWMREFVAILRKNL